MNHLFITITLPLTLGEPEHIHEHVHEHIHEHVHEHFNIKTLILPLLCKKRKLHIGNYVTPQNS